MWSHHLAFLLKALPLLCLPAPLFHHKLQPKMSVLLMTSIWSHLMARAKVGRWKAGCQQLGKSIMKGIYIYTACMFIYIKLAACIENYCFVCWYPWIWNQFPQWILHIRPICSSNGLKSTDHCFDSFHPSRSNGHFGFVAMRWWCGPNIVAMQPYIYDAFWCCCQNLGSGGCPWSYNCVNGGHSLDWEGVVLKDAWMFFWNIVEIRSNFKTNCVL